MYNIVSLSKLSWSIIIYRVILFIVYSIRSFLWLLFILSFCYIDTSYYDLIGGSILENYFLENAPIIITIIILTTLLNIRLVLSNKDEPSAKSLLSISDVFLLFIIPVIIMMLHFSFSSQEKRDCEEEYLGTINDSTIISFDRNDNTPTQIADNGKCVYWHTSKSAWASYDWYEPYIGFSLDSLIVDGEYRLYCRDSRLILNTSIWSFIYQVTGRDDVFVVLIATVQLKDSEIARIKEYPESYDNLEMSLMQEGVRYLKRKHSYGNLKTKKMHVRDYSMDTFKWIERRILSNKYKKNREFIVLFCEDICTLDMDKVKISEDLRGQILSPCGTVNDYMQPRRKKGRQLQQGKSFFLVVI